MNIRKVLENNYLIISIMSSLLVVLKMYTGNNSFLVIFLIIMLFSIFFEKRENKICYLLFFASWSYVLKFNNQSYSLFLILSLFYLFLGFAYLITNKTRFNLLVVTIFFAVYTLAIPMIHNGNMVTAFGYIINFLVIFIGTTFTKNKNNYLKYINSYAYGLIGASLIRLLSYRINRLDQFISNMTRINTIFVDNKLNIRFAGLDLDPNYYAVQVIFIISCLLVARYYRDKNLFRVNIKIFVLIVFGIMSFSKMYLIVALLEVTTQVPS